MKYKEDIAEKEVEKIIKGFRQNSIEINQDHIYKWILQFKPDTQSIISKETLHILKNCISDWIRLVCS